MSFLKSVFKHTGNLLTGGAFAARDASRQQRRANAVQQRIEERSMMRDRLTQLREAQIARATATQGAVSSGVADSSGLQGQLASMQSTVAGNLAFSQQVETGVGVINMYNRRAAKFQSQAGLYSAARELALKAGGVG